MTVSASNDKSRKKDGEVVGGVYKRRRGNRAKSDPYSREDQRDSEEKSEYGPRKRGLLSVKQGEENTRKNGREDQSRKGE